MIKQWKKLDRVLLPEICVIVQNVTRQKKNQVSFANQIFYYNNYL